MKIWKTLQDVDSNVYKSVRCDKCYKEFHIDDKLIELYKEYYDIDLSDKEDKPSFYNRDLIFLEKVTEELRK